MRNKHKCYSTLKFLQEHWIIHAAETKRVRTYHTLGATLGFPSLNQKSNEPSVLNFTNPYIVTAQHYFGTNIRLINWQNNKTVNKFLTKLADYVFFFKYRIKMLGSKNCYPTLIWVKPGKMKYRIVQFTGDFVNPIRKPDNALNVIGCYFGWPRVGFFMDKAHIKLGQTVHLAIVSLYRSYISLFFICLW